MEKLKNFLFLHRYKITFCLLAILVIADQWILMRHFTFLYLDDDQSVMWYGAKEFASGKFHEPYFFGQPYNTLAESFVAVPLLKMGISYAVALTCVMSSFGLFPFFLLACLLYKRDFKIQSLIVLSIPILLSPNFAMSIAISRGCAVGIFLSIFAILALYSKNKNRFFLFGFFSMLALFANQNAVVVLFPAGIWLLMENYRDWKFYAQTFIGAIPGMIIWYFAHRFYVVHPEYIVHNSWPLDFSFKRIRLIDLVNFFEDVIPVFWLGPFGILLFPTLLAMSVILFRQKEKSAAIGLLAGTVLLFLSIGINKVHDGYPTVFYSWSRMFMGVPLFIALFISKINFSKFSGRWWLLLLFPIVFFIGKCTNAEHSVNREVQGKNEYNMYVGKISHIKNLCETVQTLSEKYNVNLIVAGPHFTKHVLSYACPCLQENFPKIIEPSEDRRTWLLKDEDGKIRSSILFVAFWEQSFSDELKAKYGMTKISDDPLIYLLTNNKRETGALLDSLKIPMRKH